MKIAVAILTLSLVFLIALVPPAGADDTFDLFNFLKLLDLEQCLLKSYQCMPFACVDKWGIPIGDRICHNVPVGFVETPTAPFTTVVPMVGVILDALSNSMGQYAGSGGSSSSSSGGTHLKYFEAHVFNMPTRTFIKLRYPFLKLCYYGSTPWEVNYVSEADEPNWRTGLADFLTMDFLTGAILQISQACSVTQVADNIGDAIGENISIGGQLLGDACMGTWGVTYPRTGYSNAYSEPVASGIAAYRASRVVAKPLLRLVFMPKLFDPNLKMQLGYPSYGKPLNCFSKGATPLVWDNFTTKLPKGTGYIWVLWEKTCCCYPPTGCVGLPGTM
jgi:hypothetical protein